MRSPSKASVAVLNKPVEIYCKLGDTRQARKIFE